MIDLETRLEILDAVEERRRQRRAFLRYAGGATVAAGGLAMLAACDDDDDDNPTPTPSPSASPTPTPQAQQDIDVLNFALNLEYVEAQFYSFAAFGVGLDASLLTGVGTQGAVMGGSAVPFQDQVVAQYAREIALDESAHVRFLRQALGSAAVAQPALDIRGGAGGPFAAAAAAAGVANGSSFNPYADDNSFLIGGYVFEDVGVTAYLGAAPLLSSPTYLEAAAGILAVEAYHASLLRTALYAKGLQTPSLRTVTQQISDLRDSLDGTANSGLLNQGGDRDQGLVDANTTAATSGLNNAAASSNIVPTDPNGLAFARSPNQVLNIVYAKPGANNNMGGFFPAGFNGNIRVS